MIRKMSHATIFVNNQNEALEFYRDKLGFKVHTDAMVGEEFPLANHVYKRSA